MPADNDRDALDRWLGEQVRPLPPPPGTFELITRRARRRKIRRAVVSVASAAAVAAAVGIAVPVGMLLNVSPPPENGQVAAGEKPVPSGAQSNLSAGARPTRGSAAPSAAASPAATASGGQAAAGYLPPNFTPVSVTWDSLSTGWVLGPAGTAGHCANPDPDICTSIARTDDGGQTWHGLPAPDTVSPGGRTGVTGLRFLNASYGWAFGPELWATGNGGATWHKVDAGGAAVTDLETSDGRAFALFGDCPADRTLTGCTSYTLMTAVAGSDDWTRVDGVPAGLSTGASGSASAVITLAGPAGHSPATGYLAAPDGTLYAGPLDGTAWHQAGTLPCRPGAAASDGLPAGLQLTPAGPASSGSVRLGLVCAAASGGGTVAYRSGNGGTSWTKQSAAGSLGTPRSLTALSDGTLILATTTAAAGPGGIYLLSPGASRWTQATLSGSAGDGFSFAGMTSATQGVAIGGGDARAVWMTANGGQTWELRPITS
jgi:hypothetical protein